MKKKNYKKASKNFSPLVVIIFSLIILFICLRLATRFLIGSPIFRIKKISYPKAIELSKDSYIFELIGKNLFSLNLEEVTRKMKQESPQLSGVRILMRLPDELVIEAQKRNPVAQLSLSDRYFYVDSEGIIYPPDNQQENLPVILGVVNRPASLRAWQVYDDINLKFALEIIQRIAKIPYLKNLVLAKINVSNLNRTSIAFSNSIEVIIGEERLKEKLELLTIVFSRLAKELDQIKYIDLRFKEPVIGKK